MVTHLGDENFNSFDNNRTAYPVVADPDVAQINRAWVKYSGFMNTELKVGRQAINLDNQRFIGTVGWRQNDQTFDAINVKNMSLDNLTLQYSYIDNVNRIFDGTTPPDNLESVSHLARAQYKFSDALIATAYGYWFDFDNAAALSNETYGVRLTGATLVSENVKLAYEVEYAQQSDHGDNTANYDADYYHIAPTLKIGSFGLGLGYEVLEGDGTNSFKTPLATGHKFNGWADKFLSTPANGLEDKYISAQYSFKDYDMAFLNGVKIKAAYHDFDGDEAGDYGDEINLAISRNFKIDQNDYPFKNINLLLKFADYNAEDAPYTDTQKIWFQIGTKF